MPSKKTIKKQPPPKVAAVAVPEKAPEKKMNFQLREDATSWILSFASIIVLWAIVANAVIALYHPDVAAFKKTGEQLFIEEHLVNPEPVEALIFRLSVLVLVPAVVLLYGFLRKQPFVKKIAAGIGFHIISWVCAVLLSGLIYAALAAVNPYGPLGGKSPQNRRDITSTTNFEFYFDSLFLGDHLWVYLLVIVPLVALLFFVGFKKYKLDEKRIFNIPFNAVCLLVATFVVCMIVSMNTVNYPYTDENKYDFAAVYYAMTQVYAGSPMLANNFTDTYGMYPHFLLPLFRITGLSITKFSLVMSLLLGFSFIMNLWLLRKLVKNNALLFLGFFTVVFFPYLNFKLLTIFDCLFSLYPIRYIIPCITACLALVYFNRRSRWLYYATWAISGMLVLWNPEIGIVCYMAWAATNLYADYYNSEGKTNTKPLAFHVVMACLVLPATLLLYKAFVYLAYGQTADIGSLFSTIAYFGKYGVGLLKMSVLHPWNLTALVLLAGFLYAGIAWHQKRITPNTTMVLLLCVISTGYFTYFQGRSQNSNFALSSGFPLIVLTILADRLWLTIRSSSSMFSLDALFVIMLGCLAFSPVEIVYNAQKIIALNDQDEAKQQQKGIQQRIAANTALMKQTSKEHEKIIALTLKKNQPLFFNDAKRQSAFNPGYIDMFLKEDLVQLEDKIIDSSYKVYVELRNKNYAYMARVRAALAALYEPTANNGYIVLLQKRKQNIPAATFFTGDDMMLHRKYTSDRAGALARINDGEGIKPMELPDSFSVSILFYTAPQYISYAALVGNFGDTSGFMMSQETGPYSYIFGVSTMAATMTLPGKKWTYMVMNVTPAHLEIYHNGSLVVVKELTEPMRQSKKSMSIGNIGNTHNFTGAIAEVAITKRLTNSNEIKQTWERIEPALQPAP